jgi:hypothetical protein
LVVRTTINKEPQPGKVFKILNSKFKILNLKSLLSGKSKGEVF